MLKRHYKPWSAGDLRELDRLYYETELSWLEIGEKLGRTPTACLSRMRMIRFADFYQYGEEEATIKDHSSTISKERKNVIASEPDGFFMECPGCNYVLSFEEYKKAKAFNYFCLRCSKYPVSQFQEVKLEAFDEIQNSKE